MKLFPYYADTSTYHTITRDIALFVQTIVARLTRTTRPHQIIQLALFIFHSHAKIVTYHRFDRFMHASAAILLAGKLTEQLQYPIDILKESRKVLRERRGVEGEDSEQKTKSLLKKLFEAEINLMISVGFDFQLEVGVDQLQGWEKAVKDRNFLRTACEILTKLYHTNIVIYFQPKDLALAALVLAGKAERVTPEVSGWQNELLLCLKSREETTKRIIQIYYKKINENL